MCQIKCVANEQLYVYRAVLKVQGLERNGGTTEVLTGLVEVHGDILPPIAIATDRDMCQMCS